MSAREELIEAVATRGQVLYPLLVGLARQHTREAAATLVDEVLARRDLLLEALGGRVAMRVSNNDSAGGAMGELGRSEHIQVVSRPETFTELWHFPIDSTEGEN